MTIQRKERSSTQYRWSVPWPNWPKQMKFLTDEAFTINGRKHTLTHTDIHIHTHTHTYIHTHTYKHIPTVKFNGATIDCHLNMKLLVEHLERTCVIGRMNVTRLNLTNTTMLICLYKIVVRIHGLCSSSHTKQNTEKPTWSD